MRRPSAGAVTSIWGLVMARARVETRGDGRMAMTRVTLRPKITWQGEWPSVEAIADLHHRAHEACFIANSVTTEVTVQF